MTSIPLLKACMTTQLRMKRVHLIEFFLKSLLSYQYNPKEFPTRQQRALDEQSLSRRKINITRLFSKHPLPVFTVIGSSELVVALNQVISIRSEIILIGSTS